MLDLAVVHYVEKTYVENEGKLSRVVEYCLDDLKPKKKKIHIELCPYKNEADLRAHAKEILDDMIESSSSSVEFSDKIFRHDLAERRVTFRTIDNFHRLLSGRGLTKDDFHFAFAHLLQGKNE